MPSTETTWLRYCQRHNLLDADLDFGLHLIQAAYDQGVEAAAAHVAASAGDVDPVEMATAIRGLKGKG